MLNRTDRLHHRGYPDADMVRALGVSAEPALAPDRTELPRIISPGNADGIMPGAIHKEGSVGIVSRSGTLTTRRCISLRSAASGSRRRSALAGPIIGTEFCRRARPV